MRRFAHFLIFAAALAPAFAIAEHGVRIPAAEASVSVLATLDELVMGSSYAVVATAKDRYCQWEEIAGGKRIVTYTKLKIDRTIFGSPPAEVWVRTLGGVVGNIGQSVAGEAQFTLEAKSLVFLAKLESATVVTGMAQGHFPIVEAPKTAAKLASSPDTGGLLTRRGPSISAREKLVGATLDDGIALITASRKSQDAKK